MVLHLNLATRFRRKAGSNGYLLTPTFLKGAWDVLCRLPTNQASFEFQKNWRGSQFNHRATAGFSPCFHQASPNGHRFRFLFFYPQPRGSGSKNQYQNGTLVSGNMDQNLRFAPPV